jgi:Flp pilus assembly protein TadG
MRPSVRHRGGGFAIAFGWLMLLLLLALLGFFVLRGRR